MAVSGTQTKASAGSTGVDELVAMQSEFNTHLKVSINAPDSLNLLYDIDDVKAVRDTPPPTFVPVAQAKVSTRFRLHELDGLCTRIHAPSHPELTPGRKEPQSYLHLQHHTRDHSCVWQGLAQTVGVTMVLIAGLRGSAVQAPPAAHGW